MPKIVALHLIALVLCLPLFGTYVLSSGSEGSEVGWVIAAASMVYVGVLLTSKPKSVFESASKVGIGSGAMKLILLSVTLVMLCVPLLDAQSGMAAGVGITCMVGAAVSFVAAVRLVYSEPSIGV